MPLIPSFLKRLGLDASADERAVRRAYAAHLKALDPEIDPSGFQALHEAYQAALAWVRNGPIHQTPSASPPAPRPPDTGPIHSPVPEPPPREAVPRAPTLRDTAAPVNAEADPHALAEAVFDSFRKEASAWPQKRSRRIAKIAEQALARHLSDTRLLPLEARRSFEERIVGLLTEPGLGARHATLRAASRVFHWERDRRRLDMFGAPGARVNQEIDLELLRNARPRGLRPWLRKKWAFTFFGRPVTRAWAIIIFSFLIIMKALDISSSNSAPPPVMQGAYEANQPSLNPSKDARDALAIPAGIPSDPGPSQEKALARFDALEPQRPSDWLCRGYARQRKGLGDLAMADYNEAIRLSSNTAVALNNRGILWLQRSEFDLAMSDFQEAARLDGHLAAARFNEGRIWAWRGDKGAAAKDFTAALKMDPRLKAHLPDEYQGLISTPAGSRSGSEPRGH